MIKNIYEEKLLKNLNFIMNEIILNRSSGTPE